MKLTKQVPEYNDVVDKIVLDAYNKSTSHQLSEFNGYDIKSLTPIDLRKLFVEICKQVQEKQIIECSMLFENDSNEALLFKTCKRVTE